MINIHTAMDNDVEKNFKQRNRQCFDAVGLAAGRASGRYKTEWWAAGVVICLERLADIWPS